ncbi:hypothetical protein [Helicobacter canis]|uniref:hypothetical protein n=1 Tax=Helicobacter canis TaxID=29419 RepID=UPI00294224B6|nr:hypothetical protein [Helicobacter canis]
MRYLQVLCATILFTAHTQAAGMIVESPSLLGQMLKQYQQYVEMLEKAHEQINKLNEINAMMGKANDILNKQSLTIANPLEVIENLNKTLESIKYNADQLGQSVKDYEIGKTIKFRNLQKKCPFLDLENLSPNSDKIETNKIGEDTPLKKDIQALLDEFTDITAYDINTLYGSLKGLPLAMVMCEKLASYEKALQLLELDNAQNAALLSNDYNLYKQKQQEKIKYLAEKELAEQDAFEKKLTPLKVRVEQMKQSLGVTNKTLNEKGGMQFCEETKDGGCAPILLHLDYIKHKEQKMLENAAKNSNADKSQSQADREFIMIDYLREIASHIAFLNETMAITANYLAEEKERSQNTIEKKITNEQMFKNKEQEVKQIVITNPNAIVLMPKDPRIDKNGFPVFETGKKGSSSGI